MSKKCVYCSKILEESEVIDVCTNCGLKVWGENMFSAIKKNMETAKESGNLYQGSISEPNLPKKYKAPESLDPKSNSINQQKSTQVKSNPLSFLTKEAMNSQERFDAEREKALDKESNNQEHIHPTQKPETLKPQQDIFST